MPSKRIEFLSHQGEPLAGRLELPDTPPVAWAIFAHCFTCSKDSQAAVHISRALAEAGFGVLRFDFTGLGGSGGDFSNTNFSSNIDDLVAAADWLREQHGAPALLIGHSLGGTAVLAAAHRIADSKAVVTIGAPFDPSHVSHHFGRQLACIQEAGEAEVELAGRTFTIRRQMLDDLNEQKQDTNIRKLRRALLVLHAPLDDTVGIDNATHIFVTAMHPKSFVSLDQANHLLSNKQDARFAASVIAAWASRYALAQRSATTPSDTPDKRVTVAERGTGNFAVAITAGKHSLLADEPVDVGGDDSGPNPYQLLSAALGACTAMTLRMYARHKQLPLEHVSVTLNHQKVHAKDCAECETKSGQIDRIEREITLTGDLTDEQRQRLLDIADKCPVHRTLHSEVLVSTRLIPPGD